MRLQRYYLAALALGTAVWGVPQQRPGSCTCKKVICPNNGRDACECHNRAMSDCWLSLGGQACSSPIPQNCNGLGVGRPNPPPPAPGFSSYTTYYQSSVIPYRTTLTTTISGFGFPGGITSYSFGNGLATSHTIRTTTVTLPPGSWPPFANTGGYTPYTSTFTYSPSYSQYTPSSSATPWNPFGWVTSTRSSNSPSDTPSPTQTPSPYTPYTYSTSKPAPWTPPGGGAAGGTSQWTTIGDPNAPPTSSPTPTSAPASVAATSAVSSSSSSAAGPPVIPAGPNGSDVVVCGPGLPKCSSTTYCDPQPLCSIGEDCIGVCLPLQTVERFSDTSINPYQQLEIPLMQPMNIRRTIWDELLRNGTFEVLQFDLGFAS